MHNFLRHLNILFSTFGTRCLGFCTAFFIFLTSPAQSQISDKVSSISVNSFEAGKPLSLQVQLNATSTLRQIDIAYRSFGSSEFKHKELVISGNTASVSIPANDLTPPFIEYYLILSFENSSETYPRENPEQQPLKIDLVSSPTGNRSGVTILSPEEDERVAPENLLISFSLLRADSIIDRQATRVFLDGTDITTYMVASGDLMVVRLPDEASILQSLEAGSHSIRVDLYTVSGKLSGNASWNFTLRGVAASTTTLMDGASMSGSENGNAWRYHTNVQLETRHETISDQATPYNRATISANGTYGNFRLVGRLYGTNEENERRQPQNRFFIGGESPWLKLGYGDSYPMVNDLIMSGRRVRGINGSLSVGPFSLDVVKGDIVRKIESDVVTIFPAESLASEQQRDPSGSYGLYDNSQWAKYRYGVFDRDITVIRPSFSAGSSRWGFSYLHSKDDPGSIRYGSRPQENLVLGSDVLLAFDDRNIELTGQTAVSVSNRDISLGTLNDQQISELFTGSDSISQREDLKQLRDIFDRFITINQNLVPLSLKNAATLAYEGGLSLNYFNNNFRFSYVRRGNSYESFGQSFLRTDVKGFAVSDRLRLVDNQLLLSAGFEQLKDNTAQTKPTTTTNTTISTGISYFPRNEWPSITVAYFLAANDNPLPLDSTYAVDDRMHRVLVQFGRQYQLGGFHQATLTINTSARNDRTIANLDTRTTGLTLSNRTTFRFPFQTTISVSYNDTRFSLPTFSSNPSSLSPIANDIAYTTLYVNGQYLMIDGNLRLSGTVSPTFGDIQRTLLEAGAQYYFMKNLSLQSLLNFYLHADTGTDVIWSFVLRMDV